VKANSPQVGARVWQRNYYERVIRNQTELERVRLYIVDSPRSWHVDPENPQRDQDSDHEADWAWLEQGSS
jgi:putative transposase